VFLRKERKNAEVQDLPTPVPVPVIKTPFDNKNPLMDNLAKFSTFQL